jgi:hypothetical protein
MAEWKKVIVSGSNAHLNNITSSADVSCRGDWFANLPEADNQEVVVVFDQTTGQFKQRTLSSFPGIG